MSEAYPSDNELLNLISDEQTGVEYIPTGTSPYYLHFRRLLYRLLLAAGRANDLRVFDEGGLNIGVKSGAFFLGNTLIEYAGSSGNELADDKPAIYVYLDAEGNLVTNQYTAFPNMADEPHIRLAVVSTGGGDITSINDSRGSHIWQVPFAAGGIKDVIEAHSADDTLNQSESGSVHTNLGATGTIMLTLPAGAEAGTRFAFAVQAAQQLRIEPGTAAIFDSSGQTAGKYKYADAIGACITLIADANGDWAVISKSGSWSQEA